jgi:peptide/nickel transport system substrate-binding protein
MKRKFALLAAAALTAAMAMTATVSAAEKTDLTIAVDADVDSLHLSDFSTTVEMDILNQIYDPLMYMNPDGDHDPEPRIAESYEISEDGLDYTFHLRDDVTFHDGTPLTAEDVKFSLELYMDSEYQDAQVTGCLPPGIPVFPVPSGRMPGTYRIQGLL